MHEEQRCVNCMGAIVLKGWSCGRCGVFNGAEKEIRETCRSCGALKPVSDKAIPQSKGDGPQRWWRAMPSCGGPWCYDDSITNLVAMIDDGACPGQSYTIECVELTPEQVANMGDFGGW